MATGAAATGAAATGAAATAVTTGFELGVDALTAGLDVGLGPAGGGAATTRVDTGAAVIGSSDARTTGGTTPSGTGLSLAGT
jgi:hypothetical protein